jgi:hypothetical protein
LSFLSLSLSFPFLFLFFIFSIHIECRTSQGTIIGIGEKTNTKRS